MILLMKLYAQPGNKLSLNLLSSNEKEEGRWMGKITTEKAQHSCFKTVTLAELTLLGVGGLS